MTYPPPSSPYPAPPPQGGKVRYRGRTPRRLGWIFLVLAIVAIVVGAVVLAKKSFDKVNGFQRITLSSGSGSVNINRTGKWVIYYEASNVSSSISQVPIVPVQVTDPSGHVVSLTSYGNRSDGKITKLTYDYNGHHGAALYQFNVSQKGNYSVQVQTDASLPSGADVAFGEDITSGTVAGGILIVVGVLFLVASIVLLIVGFVKRSRNKKELASGGGGYGGYPPPGGGYGGAGYPQQGNPLQGYQGGSTPQGYPQQGGGYPQQGGGYPQQGGGYPQQGGGYPQQGGGYPQQGGGYPQGGYPPPTSP